MTRWHRYAGKFTVKISYAKDGTATAVIPKPLISIFDQPDKVTFKVTSDAIIAEFTKADT